MKDDVPSAVEVHHLIDLGDGGFLLRAQCLLSRCDVEAVILSIEGAAVEVAIDVSLQCQRALLLYEVEGMLDVMQLFLIVFQYGLCHDEKQRDPDTLEMCCRCAFPVTLNEVLRLRPILRKT